MNEGCIYFIEATAVNRIKIGFARDDLGQRLRALQTGCPVELRSLGYELGGKELEAELHARFAHLRFAGEWFDGAEELRAYIREHASPGLYRSGMGRRRVSYRFGPETLRLIREISEATGQTATEVITRAVELYGRQVLRRRLAELVPVERRRPGEGPMRD